MSQKYRKLPAVGKLLQSPIVKSWLSEYPLSKISKAASSLVDQMRCEIEELLPDDFQESVVLRRLKAMLEKDLQPNLKRVINATGVVLHTNLGRAILSKESTDMIVQVAESYNNLELNLDSGKRGSRYSHVEDLLCELTGAEAAMVVNNNAAAVLLVLREMAMGGEVIVSRGELVEIGGSFRVSEVMKESQATMVEVGTTNKTHLYDYENHITEATKLLLKVHTSNFRVVGFTKSVSSEELVELGNKKGIPVYEDLGSGMLFDLKARRIGDEPTVQEVVKSGVDIVSFSGDKLLGGPQAGIIVGKKKYIDRIKKNQLNRALRVDKFTVAALQGTLLHYVKEEYEKIPTLQLITETEEQQLEKAHMLVNQIKESKLAIECEIIPGFSQIGGGALPLEQLPTHLVSIAYPNHSVSRAVDFMRQAPNPVVPRVFQDRIQLDVRTILPEEFPLVVETLKFVEKRCSNE
ncbi:L-seryl-tRNA(Sec) selenium transferase [Desulfuribacillus stibiiarsenatis]|uniref:L-seryl-tRNA(Sec) selenium transferase n=1 Tax=Desulfuribacillus stibiiarsenatis TaxID=1390249 RepID=A0A1E5L4G6_9FIRM|nr:L-seryl-tRNA(Sec) selenium transferase [Desulfuribacillus stibiiarsenatis]OEH85017.1 L-seryl-tRNA(Sec) selenium transferase [Desulfuribacillus stibiiarsenatis]